MKNNIGIIIGGVAIFLAVAYVVSQLTKSGAVAVTGVPQNTPVPLRNSPPLGAATSSSAGNYASGTTSIFGALSKLFGGASSPSPVSPSMQAPVYGPAAVPIGVNNGQTIYAPAGGFTSTALNPATDPSSPPSLILSDNPINLDYLTSQPDGIFPPGIATDTTSDYSDQVGTGSLLYAN